MKAKSFKIEGYKATLFALWLVVSQIVAFVTIMNWVF